ncbi:hypothetical protein J7J18_06445 [bacterium]|nr:hypothetical protein [bacterium]
MSVEGEKMPEKVVVTSDQEVWVKERIRTAIQMAMSLKQARKVQADHYAYTYGLDGVIEGTALEIIHLLGLEPSYVNLRRR